MLSLKENASLQDWLWLALTPLITPLNKQKWIQQHAGLFNIRQHIRRTFPSASTSNTTEQQIKDALEWHQASPTHHIITLNNPSYPPRLKQISTPPLVLFVHGNPDLLLKPQLAIVGSRKATPLGLKIAHHFAQQLSQSGLIITSGLAHGIDTQAHQGALAAAAPTIAILGTGINRIYPHANRQLAQRIQDVGAVVSELPINSPPKAHHFPQRNRVISGLCLGTLVVEAQIKSGSLITARHALEQNRSVFAIPGSILNKLSTGCHELIKAGATLVNDYKDIINEITPQLGPNHGITPCNKKQHQQNTLDRTQGNLLEYIDFSLTTIGHLENTTGMPIAKINSILSFLELNGYIKKMPGGYIRVR